MNTFKKYCPNVFVMETEETFKKGDLTTITTKYGKDVDVEVYNLIGSKNGKNLYSIVRIENKNYAERKAEKYRNSAALHMNASNKAYQASQEGREFLVLAEPIKIGHHSEGRHRALIERNWNRMAKSVKEQSIAAEKESKVKYWEEKASEINLSMPESLEFYKHKYEQAKEYHAGLKDGTIKRDHSYSLPYANNEVKEAEKNMKIADILWGER